MNLKEKKVLLEVADKIHNYEIEYAKLKIEYAGCKSISSQTAKIISKTLSEVRAEIIKLKFKFWEEDVTYYGKSKEVQSPPSN